MKKAILSLITAILGFSLLATPVFAATCHCEGDEAGKDTGVKTAFLGKEGCYCATPEEDGDGSGILGLLDIVVNILTVGIGVIGVIGITVVGIQYLTAGGSEEKTRKAKRRMLEIVIGLAAYAVAYAFLKWLLPGFK